MSHLTHWASLRRLPGVRPHHPDEGGSHPAEHETNAIGTPVIVHLDWGRNPISWRLRQESGEVGPGDPYGYAALSDYYDLTYSHDHPEGRVQQFLRRGIKKALGFDLVHAWRNRKVLREARYVVTHTEHEYLAVLLLDLLRGERRPRVLCNSIWLWDRWEKMSVLRRRLLLVLLRRSLVHTVHSSDNYAIASQVDLARPVVQIRFGIHPVEALHPDLDTDRRFGIRLLAAGNDRHRDWECLGEAVKVLADVDLRIRSGRRQAAALRSIGADVRRSANVSEYHEELRWADIVVVPLVPNSHASGITVALEGLSAGRPVVIADCGGVRDYLGDQAAYYEPGDPNSLASAIETVLAERPAVGPVVTPFSLESRGLTARDHALRHVIVLDGLENWRFDDASEFRPVEPRPGVR